MMKHIFYRCAGVVSAMMGGAMAAACNGNAGLVVSASNLNTLIRKKQFVQLA